MESQKFIEMQSRMGRAARHINPKKDYDYLIIQMPDLEREPLREFVDSLVLSSQGEDVYGLSTTLTYVYIKDKYGLYLANPDTPDDIALFKPYIAMHESFMILKGPIGTHDFFVTMYLLAELQFNTDDYFDRFKHLGGYRLGSKKVLRVCYDSKFKIPSIMTRYSFHIRYDYVILCDDQGFEDDNEEKMMELINEITTLEGCCGIKQGDYVRYYNDEHADFLATLMSDKTYEAMIAFEGPMNIARAFEAKSDVTILARDANDYAFFSNYEIREAIYGGKLTLVIISSR